MSGETVRNTEIDFAQHRHYVQFYSGDEHLVDVLTTFIGAALGGGGAAIVIATAEHRTELAKRLAESGMDVPRLIQQGRFLALDAADTLAQITVNGWPDERRFHELLGGTISRASAAAESEHARTALFGEMVALLCERGNAPAAIRLEELWNELADAHSFSLVCGYALRQFIGAEHSENFQKICEMHSAVFPAEEYAVTSEQQHLRLAAQSQQRALVLETEIARRHKAQQEASRLAAIVESSSDAIASMDLNGIVTSWNASAEGMFGYKAEEIVGKSITTIVPPELHKDEEMILARIRRDEPIKHFETVRVTKSGRRLDVSLTVSPVKDENGRIVGAAKTLRNITQRKRTEKRVAAQHAVTAILADSESLAQAAEPILNGLCEALDWHAGALWHVDDRRQHLHCLAMCSPVPVPAFMAVTKASSFERGIGLPGRVWQTNRPCWINDTTVDGNFPRRAVALREGIRSAVAFPISTPTRALGAMEFFSKDIRKPDQELMNMMAAIGSQIGQFIERKTAEVQLRESEERFRTMAESAPEAIFRIDESSIVLFANSAVEEVLGYKPEEVVGKELTLLMPEYLRDAHRSGLKRYIVTGKKHLNWHHAELVGRHKDGREIALEVSFSEGSFGGRRIFTGFARDITERKRTDAALRRAERMAATGQLAATIAHEINNPMQALTNLLALVKDRTAREETTHQLVSMAEKELGRMSHITRQMLSFYRASPRPVSVRISEVLDDVLDLFLSKIHAKQITVERRYDFTGEIQAFPVELRQLFANLVTNAIEAMGRGGHIDMHVSAMRNGTRPGVRVVVADNGPGIKPEVRKRVFEPFFTTKAEKGTGLGLWVVKGIVEKHNGILRVRSSVQPGRSGTVFSVFLPISQSSNVVPIDGGRDRDAAA